MSQEYRSRVLQTGTRLQSGIPKRFPRMRPGDATGMIFRGVVTATYVTDDENHPFTGQTDAVPTSVYCDVLAFGRRWRFIPKCLVAQERSGLHSGRIWKPRACSMTLTGDPVDLNRGTNPAKLDGDHVLVGFLDGNANQPIILKALPHPAADVGNEDFGTGHRLKLKVDDGDPDFVKHNGTFFGVDKQGDFYLDTTHANDGELLDATGEEGHEAEPPTDGKGAVNVNMPQDAVWTLQLLDMSDPLNPVQVVTREIDKESFLQTIVDKAVARLKEDRFEIELDDLTKRLIVTTSLIELGAEGASDKATLDSLLQAELGKISTAIADLVQDFNEHTHPLPKFIAPLIPLSDAPCVPNDDPTNDGIVITTTKISLVNYSKADTASALVTIDS